jgi:RNA polymerase sigma factor (sigma-70 family)
MLEESQLIKLLRQQDRRTQEILYKQYFGRWMSICMRYTCQWDDAMLVLNNGFLKIYGRIDDYKGNGSFEGWMRRIIVNSALDFLRTRKMEVVHIDYIIDTAHEQSDSIELYSDLELEEVLSIIKLLPTTTRTVFNLYAIDGFTHQEIAEKMKISSNTSAWHVSIARTELKKRIALKKNKNSAR